MLPYSLYNLFQIIVIIYIYSILNNCLKIGEGVYGEVFKNHYCSGESTVLKIIPIEGCVSVNGEPQKGFHEILPEIIISSKLSELRNDTHFSTSGFVQLKNVRCVQGKYPKHLIEHWENYDKKNNSENEHPNIFIDSQIFIVLELADAGIDMESVQFRNAIQATSIFKQVCVKYDFFSNFFIYILTYHSFITRIM